MSYVSHEMVQAFQISSLNFDIATGITPLGAVHIVSLSADGRMMAVEVKARPEFGIPKRFSTCTPPRASMSRKTAAS